MEELRKAIGGDIMETAEGAAMLDLDPAQVEAVLSTGFFIGSNILLRRLRREGVTDAEADKFAKVTRIVFAQWICKVEVGMVAWALTTAGILASKEKLDKVPATRPNPTEVPNAQGS